MRKVSPSRKRPGVRIPEETAQLRFTLRPVAAREQIIVSAARTQIGLSEAPGSSVLLSETDVKAAPALSIDDILRQVPGFSLFRRTGEADLAIPQLWECLCVGWVRVEPAGHWCCKTACLCSIPSEVGSTGTVLPREAIAGAEVFRGGSSGLYGSNALGGVIQVFTREPVGPAIKVETSYGNEDSPDLSLWAGEKIGHWEASS